ncbi:MAG: transposase [Elusimicrobiota bacterium]
MKMPNTRRGDLGRPSFIRIRKSSLRLKTWDYFLPGPYFFTICTFEREKIFNDQIIREKTIEVLKNIAKELGIVIHGIIIATNHLHGLITLSNDRKINLWQQYIGKVKVKVTQTIIGWASPPLREHDRIWQRSFYDHIIRNEKDFLEKAKYIEKHTFKEESDIYAEWH